MSDASRRAWLGAAVLVFGVIGCGDSGGGAKGPANTASGGSNARALLVEVTREAGIDFVHDAFRQGEYLFPEITGSGCAFLDFDNDGFLDIYLIQSGRDLKRPGQPGKPNALYRNRGNGTFENVTAKSGAGDTGYGQGLAVGDYDNNGFVDLYVANVGGPSALLRNNGDGTFADVTAAAGVANGAWAITPAFVDYDHDGHLDLIATNYVDWSVERDTKCYAATGVRDYCGPLAYKPAPSILYHNDGDGTFSDVTVQSGLSKAFGAGMGILCADFNDDGLVDIFVANDTFPNQLWLNHGDGTFVDEGLLSGLAVSGDGTALSSMGTNVEDLNGDGRLDVFTTNYMGQGSVLYVQDAGGFFRDVSRQSKLFTTTVSSTGFGACFLDLFNTGDLYLYVGNGAAGQQGVEGHGADPYADYAQRDQVLRWSPASMAMSDVSGTIGPAMQAKFITRGVAVGDYDNDGDVDVLISCNSGPARLLRNDAPAAGQHWLMVRCLTRDGKRDALGAKVFVTAGGATRRRDVIVNYSYASACDPRIHFGLGPRAVAERIVVKWPGGGESVYEDVPANQVFVARQPMASSAAAH